MIPVICIAAQPYIMRIIWLQDWYSLLPSTYYLKLYAWNVIKWVRDRHSHLVGHHLFCFIYGFSFLCFQSTPHGVSMIFHFFFSKSHPEPLNELVVLQKSASGVLCEMGRCRQTGNTPRNLCANQNCKIVKSKSWPNRVSLALPEPNNLSMIYKDHLRQRQNTRIPNGNPSVHHQYFLMAI